MISADIEIDDGELDRRKAFLEITADDVGNLAGINELAQRYADAVIDDFYSHLLGFEETRKFFADPQVLKRVKNLQKDYFLRLTQGNYDRAYMENRVRIGSIHEHIDLPVKSYLGMYSFYLRAVSGRLIEAHQKHPHKAWAAFLSLMKLTFLDMGLAIDTYIASRERTIRAQQEAMRELPTPVLPFREGMLLVPVIGTLDAQRARQLTEQVLASIRTHRAKVVVIDITGVQSIDTLVANNIVQTVESGRLMGATAIIAGISPEVAHTMVTLGIDLNRIMTVGDLQSAIERGEQLLGYVVAKNNSGAAAANGHAA